MEPMIPGPDGFLLSPNDPLYGAHVRLNDYLLGEEQRNPALTPFDVTIWRKLPRRELVNQVTAVLERFAWLDQHDSQLENAHVARIRLATLLRVLYSIKIPYTEPDLRILLERTTPLLGRIAPYGPVERVMDYLKDNDLTEELCCALRQFQASLREEMSISQASMQSLRQQLHMLLWLDEWEPLDPTRCWSECVRRDFRAMTGDRRAKYRLLGPDCDPYDPATIRATMGSLFSQKLIRCSPREFTDWARSNRVAIVASSPTGLMDYKTLRYRFPAVILIGSEKRGLSEQLLECADFVVRIPMQGGCDSINVAVATGVLLFEMAGQRRSATPP